MPGLSAVVFIPDDTAKTGYSRPMMLQNIMGTPLLSWLASSLVAGGVGRFFMVCHERFRRDVRACIPDDVGFFCPAQEAVSDQLHVFLSTADESEEDVIVVTGPAIILPYANDEEEFDSAPIASPVTSVNRVTLMQALDEKFIFTEFLKDHGVPYTDRDGVYGVASLSELPEWQPVLNQCNLYRLAQQGVEIWDYNNTYVEPGVAVGAGSALLPGTILRGHTSIGCGCTIGPNSYLENAKIGDDTNVNSSQVYNSSVGYDTHIGPFAYIRPGSTIGSPSRLKQGEEAAQQESIPAFFLKRKTYNQSGKKCNRLSLCVSYLRRKPGSLKYSCESGSKRLPGSHDASQNRRSLGEAT